MKKKEESQDGVVYLFGECENTRQRMNTGQVKNLPENAQLVLHCILNAGAASPAELMKRTGLPVQDAHAAAGYLVRRRLLQRHVDDPALRARLKKIVAKQQADYGTFLKTPRASKLWNRLADQRDQADRKRQAEMGPRFIASKADTPTNVTTATRPTADKTAENRVKRQQQDKAIFDALAARNLKPNALPPYESGKRSVKADLKYTIGSKPPFESREKFETAWLRLQRQGKIDQHPKPKN